MHAHRVLILNFWTCWANSADLDQTAHLDEGSSSSLISVCSEALLHGKTSKFGFQLATTLLKHFFGE